MLKGLAGAYLGQNKNCVGLQAHLQIEMPDNFSTRNSGDFDRHADDAY